MDDTTPSTTPSKKPRFKWQPDQVSELESIFNNNHHPPQDQLEQLATKFSADISVVLFTLITLLQLLIYEIMNRM